MPAKKPIKINTDALRTQLKLKHLEAKAKLAQKHPHVEKFFREKRIDPGKIREHSAKIIGAGILTGSLLLGSPQNQKTLPAPQEILGQREDTGKVAGKAPKEILTQTFDEVLPERVRPLTREEEKFLENIIQNLTGVPARAALEGEHLNTTYGKIGAEQHLRRYPGDTMAVHPRVSEDDEGMAPGLGAWGYFAKSKDALTPDLVKTEEWYAVVQTLYLPDWNTRQPYLRNWYKYRKVLIVNTDNGNAVVAAIADSGPAAWTGKHFGGSPEVMNYLGGPRYKKGPVILFFVDDPENKVPLGPVEYNKISEITGLASGR
ncbi:hypothetical protein HYT59_00515 [Candidatus Woesebacteria bacterium]|nr:hypothetical protein [Candidatus Woesebacteria bacterium]